MKPNTKRIVWIDRWRGLAVLFMMIFHTAFNLDFLELKTIDIYSGIWFVIGNFVRLSFLLIVGLSLFLSYKRHQSHSDYLKRHLTRAFKLFLIAMGITLITWLLFPENYIRFGILHLISAGIVFGALSVRSAFIPFIAGLIALYSGAALAIIETANPYLFVFGLTTPEFKSLDYFPLFPWLGFVFFGIVLGHFLHWLKLKTSSQKTDDPLQFIGRHALKIYLIHQPVLFGILWLYYTFLPK